MFFTAVRFMVVQQLPNSGLLTFTMTNVMQISNDVNSFYNVDLASNFRILHDEVLAMSGVAASPTPSGYQSIYRKVNLKDAVKNLLFNNAATTCSGKVFFVALGNSLIAPFPNLIGYSRVYFLT